jgi:hypothetical protein
MDPPEDDGELLLDFTREYVAELNVGFETAGADLAPYAAPPEKTLVLRASDGFLTFYVPALKPEDERPRSELFKPGCHIYDYSRWDLDTICRAVTYQKVCVVNHPIGERYQPIETRLVRDRSPFPPEINFHTFSLEFQEFVTRETGLIELITVGAAPRLNVKLGVVTGIVPYRFKIWAPQLGFGPTPNALYYNWSHMDLWWMPGAWLSSGISPAKLAAEDLLGLRILSLTPRKTQFVSQSATDSAAARLQEACDEFRRLLNTAGGSEETLHQWLNRPENHLFLDANYRSIRSKLPFGRHVSDFVIERADQTYRLCEIEPATTEIFTKAGEPSARLSHACQQVRDWQRYVRDNVHTVRSELGLTDIYEPSGLVVLGRSAMIGTPEKKRRWLDMKAHGQNHVAVMTYDELCEGVMRLAESLGRVSAPA